MAINIASRWRELSGENNWAGLLDPLDLDLRRYIIHYGERTAAVGDLYNSGHSLCPKEEFFSRSGLENGNIFKYNVIKFFNAESTWIGYVAVSTDKGNVALGRRDILVAWRGTQTAEEWLKNKDFELASASELFGSGTKAKVHSGFLFLYGSAREQVRDAVRELVDKYQNEEISITVTGYSLGAALATLNAMDIVANGYNKPKSNPEKSCMVTAFTYAGPRVGNEGLKNVFISLGDHLHLLRITNAWDPVPTIPPKLFLGYADLGRVLEVNTRKSGYLKPRVLGRAHPDLTDSGDSVVDPADSNLDENEPAEEEAEVLQPALRGNIPWMDYISAHSLDVYLHGVAGVQEGGFRLQVDHDIALVNKHIDRLKDEYKIPPKWWTTNEARKHMIQMDNGHWKFVPNA